MDTILEVDVRAFDLSSEAWEGLKLENSKKMHLRMPCCPSLVVLKKSSLGTKFFAHKATGECTTAPETETHILLKQLSIEVARAHGWQADTEVVGTTPTGDGWRADVLASKGQDRVAIEVQWSSQTMEETLRRQERYGRAGIHCIWLLRQTKAPADRKLPAARIRGNPKEGLAAVVALGGSEQVVPMRDFMAAVFDGRFRWGVTPGDTAFVSVKTGDMPCWFCKNKTSIVTRIDVSIGPHAFQFSVSDFDPYPSLAQTLRAQLSNITGVGSIKSRYSRALQQPYLSNGCAHCDVLIGQHYEPNAWGDDLASEFEIRITEDWKLAMEEYAGMTGWGVYPAI